MPIVLVESNPFSVGCGAGGEGAGDFHKPVRRVSPQFSLEQPIRAATLVKMKMMISWLFTTAWMALCSEAAITLNQSEDFSGVHAWSSGNANPNPPVISPDAGPLGSGDVALRVTSNGGSGAGGRLIVYNQSLWTGDYTAASIFSIAADLRNGGSSPLSMRLALNGPGGWFVTQVAPVTAFSGWVSRVFDIRPGSLVSADGTDVVATLAAVSELRILHSAAVDFRGAKVSSSFLVDNVRAIPEPSPFLWLVLASVGVIFRKR